MLSARTELPARPSPYLLIFLSSYLLIFLSSYLLIFLSSYLLIFLSSYLPGEGVDPFRGGHRPAPV
jgi:hypothetical protein